MRALGASALVGALAFSGIGLALPAQAAVSTDAPVIINEVYGGGGNNGATHNRDFIELLNTSSEPVDISGWSVQYASATGANWQVTPLGDISIAAGGSVLVGEAFGTTTSLPGFDADVDGNISMSGTTGKVALVESETALTGSTGIATLEPVVDIVGWGSGASAFAGTAPAPGTGNATSVTRTDGRNTADNAADFRTAAPTPLGGGAVPNVDGEPGDGEGEEPGTPTAVTIAEIQGTGDVSPLRGQTVTTEGVVTAHYPTGGLNGYVIQTPGTGGEIDFATHMASDAVFVYAGTAAVTDEVALGDTVEVTGVVSEYYGLTQISVTTGKARKIADADDPQPATFAWTADSAQRESIESMLVAPGEFTVTDNYAVNQYGEIGLAAGDQPLRKPTDVAPAGSADAAAVEKDNAARAIRLDDGSTAQFGSTGSTTPPYLSLAEPVRVGASVTFDEPVIMDYRFEEWKFTPIRHIVGDGSGNDGVTFENTRTDAPVAVGGDVSVASFNVLNYFTKLGNETAGCQAYTDRQGNPNNVRGGCDQRGAWDQASFGRQQSKIVDAINALDASVVGLMEIEDSAKLGLPTDRAVATLVEALNADAGSTKWAYVPSSTELPAAAGRDVITNAIIYQPALVERTGASRALGTASGSGQPFNNAREPIAQTFTPVGGGEDFLVAVNHFKSKGSAGPFPGDADAFDGQGSSNESRERQAAALAAWIEQIADEDEAVFLAGDFNSYTQEDPMQVLYTAGYVDAKTYFGVEKATYSFSGAATGTGASLPSESGSLDHVLMNDAAVKRATGADVWNINSGESVYLEYARNNAFPTQLYEEGPYRSSDHDPVKVGFSADAVAPIEFTLLGINDFHGRIDANTVNFAGTVEQLREQAQGPSLFVSSGDNIGASLFASAVQQDQPTIDVLNALELQTSAVGNHEFDRGFADLAGRVADEADFSLLGANVYEKGTQTPALDEYDVFTIEGGITVGVIGVVTEETPSLVTPTGIADVDFGDPVEAVNRVSAQLSDGDPTNGEADVIIALFHEGAGAGTPDGATLEEEVDGGGAFASIVTETSAEVDAIFTGHTHKQYAWEAAVPGTDRTRPIVQTGSYGANIGKITLTIDPETGDVLAHTQENVPRTTTPAADLVAAYPRVAEVDAIVRDALDYAAEIGNQPVGTVSGDITTAFSGGSFVDGVWTGGSRDDRASESALGNLVAESIRSSLADLPDGAQIGVTNSGGLRAELWDTQAEFGETAVPGLADGQISYSQALAVLPFNNTMGLVTLTGAQFAQLLEQQWQRNPDGTVPSRPYLQLGLSDNVTYTYDATRAEGDRITSISVDGELMDPEAEYRIGTLSFLIAGGDNFRILTEGSDKVDTGLLDYEAWVNYLGSNSPVAPSFAKHAVQVQGETTGAPGTELTFTVSNLNMTSRGTPETTELDVWLGNEVASTVVVQNGTARVTVPIPADAPVGAQDVVVLVNETTGTEVTVPITVGEPGSNEPGTGEPGTGNPGTGTPGNGTGPGSLAITGTELPLGLALGGAFLLVAGGIAFLMRKRREGVS